MSKSGIVSIVVVALCASSLFACGGDSSLTIRNDSSVTLIEINLSPTSSSDWGPDLLGGEVLEPGESLEISEVDCGDYDIRVVDANEAACTLAGVELCFDDAIWAIGDGELAACGFAGAAAR